MTRALQDLAFSEYLLHSVNQVNYGCPMYFYAIKLLKYVVAFLSIKFTFYKQIFVLLFI